VGPSPSELTYGLTSLVWDLLALAKGYKHGLRILAVTWQRELCIGGGEPGERKKNQEEFGRITRNPNFPNNNEKFADVRNKRGRAYRGRVGTIGRGLPDKSRKLGAHAGTISGFATEVLVGNHRRRVSKGGQSRKKHYTNRIAPPDSHVRRLVDKRQEP